MIVSQTETRGELAAIKSDIYQLCEEWQRQAEEAVRVGTEMGKRLIRLERERDDLRLELRSAHELLQKALTLASKGATAAYSGAFPPGGQLREEIKAINDEIRASLKKAGLLQ